jgi:hypothetical protein
MELRSITGASTGRQAEIVVVTLAVRREHRKADGPWKRGRRGAERDIRSVPCTRRHFSPYLPDFEMYRMIGAEERT